jgi:hypothetical protein
VSGESGGYLKHNGGAGNDQHWMDAALRGTINGHIHDDEVFLG